MNNSLNLNQGMIPQHSAMSNSDDLQKMMN